MGQPHCFQRQPDALPSIPVFSYRMHLLVRFKLNQTSATSLPHVQAEAPASFAHSTGGMTHGSALNLCLASGGIPSPEKQLPIFRCPFPPQPHELAQLLVYCWFGRAWGAGPICKPPETETHPTVPTSSWAKVIKQANKQCVIYFGFPLSNPKTVTVPSSDAG